MINVLIPMAGPSQEVSQAGGFPPVLMEIEGKPVLQRIIENYDSLSSVNFHFVVNEKDCTVFHIDRSLLLLTNETATIIKLRSDTRGAACSALMAVEVIDNETPLVIANANQIIDVDYNQVIQGFVEADFDAGVLTFRSVHPKWSYVRLDEQGQIVQAAEKNPISRHAIAGFYYFRHGNFFVEAAKRMIQKDASVNDAFYVAPVLNELILDGKRVGFKEIDVAAYHSLYSEDRIEEYRRQLAQQRHQEKRVR